MAPLFLGCWLQFVRFQSLLLSFFKGELGEQLKRSWNKVEREYGSEGGTARYRDSERWPEASTCQN